ncbi:MerR family transcriptional regulator [Altererythrobacter sp. ZODW24]|uniref:MerR family transcriptional regulator n=1 Tax=Altererythrobacter sp. ZODW24 TaxID=2185142 RepID=UPI000DF7E1A6|nr:MerR family transcriptional regulator [Altererythrobacter sp. ZODW24]
MASPTFTDGKDADALRTIGEVVKATGIKAHVLRYWEQQFPMLDPLKRSGGRRYYRPEDVEMVTTIDRLVNQEGFTLKGARKALQGGVTESDQPQAAPVAAAVVAPEIIPQLKAIRSRLATALNS